MIYPWQAGQWRRLIAEYAALRLPQALLLCGQMGLGKLALANALAAVLLCETNTDQACGHCKGCHLFSAENHPDYYCLSPEEKRRVIKVDQVRQMIHSVTQTAHRGGAQVVVIAPAESLHAAAANALLKTLEEPMGQVYFILVSHAPGQLLPTITSRCQRVLLTPTDPGLLLPWLSERVPESCDPAVLLKLADGAPLRALSLQAAGVMALRDSLLSALQQCDAEQVTPSSLAADWVKQPPVLVLSLLYTVYGDVMKCLLGFSAAEMTHHDVFPLLMTLANKFTRVTCQAKMTQVQSALQVVAQDRHLNPQLLLESVLCS